MLRGDDPVAARPLRLVQGLVGPLDDRRDRLVAASSATATPTETLVAGTPMATRSSAATACADALADLDRDVARSGCAAGPRTPRRRSGPGRRPRGPRRRSPPATARRTSSPTWWPWVSLRTLNLSMSTIRTPTPSSARRRPGEQRAELVEVAPVRQAGQGVGRGAGLGLAMRVGPGESGRCLDRGAGEDPLGRRRPRARRSGARRRSRRSTPASVVERGG